MPASPRPRVLLLIPHLGGGGAERVTALLASGLDADNKYELHLGVVTQAQASGEELPSGVHLHALNASRVRDGAFRLLGLVRRLKPDLILSGMFHLNFLVLLLRPLFPRRTRVLVRQNGTVSAALCLRGATLVHALLYRLLYRYADRVICQTQAMASDLAAELRLPQSRIAVLPNPVDVAEIRDFSGVNPELKAGKGPHLLAVGRLSREKGLRPAAAVLRLGPRKVPQSHSLDCRHRTGRGCAEGRVPCVGT